MYLAYALAFALTLQTSVAIEIVEGSGNETKPSAAIEIVEGSGTDSKTSVAIEIVEGSGDDFSGVCNSEGSACPENTCCRQEQCDKEGNGLSCCEDPDSDPVGCANCPKCGRCLEVGIVCYVYSRVIFMSLYISSTTFMYILISS